MSTSAPPPPPSRTAPQFVVRLPNEDFREQIAAAAKANNRSMNAEINARLQDSFAGRLSFIPQDVLRLVRRTAEKEGRTVEGEVIDRLVMTLRSVPESPDTQSLLEDVGRAEAKVQFLEAERHSARMQMVIYADEVSRFIDLFEWNNLTDEQRTALDALKGKTAAYLAWADTEFWDIERLKEKLRSTVSELESLYNAVSDVGSGGLKP